LLCILAYQSRNFWQIWANIFSVRILGLSQNITFKTTFYWFFEPFRSIKLGLVSKIIRNFGQFLAWKKLYSTYLRVDLYAIIYWTSSSCGLADNYLWQENAGRFGQISRAFSRSDFARIISNAWTVDIRRNASVVEKVNNDARSTCVEVCLDNRNWRFAFFDLAFAVETDLSLFEWIVRTKFGRQLAINPPNNHYYEDVSRISFIIFTVSMIMNLKNNGEPTHTISTY
jgi:hypothetical protein